MTNKEAISYLLYLKHDVYAGSPVDVAIDTAIEALKHDDKTKNQAYSCPNCDSEMIKTIGAMDHENKE